MNARAVLYGRISTDEQSEASVDDQFRTCRRVGAAAGLVIVDTFKDEGISGGTSERPGYQALVAAARAGRFDVIITEDVSRLWRNRSEYGQRSAEFEDLGLHLLTCVGDDTHRDGWGLVLGIKQAIAEAYRREVSYRTKRGMEGLALAGKSTGGRCYGYQGGAVYEPEAEAVRGIFELRAGGASLGRIVDYIQSYTGWAPPRGDAWSRSTIAGILANPRYTGAVIWGATEGRGGARDSRRKSRVLRSEPIVATHDERLRIVPQNIFDAVQNRACKAA